MLTIILEIIILLLLVFLGIMIYFRNKQYVYPVGKCFDKKEMEKCINNNCQGDCKGSMACNCDFSKDNLPSKCEDLKTAFDCSSLYCGGHCGCKWDTMQQICKSK